MVERLAKEAITVSRDYFGPGKTGQMAFELIEGGVSCGVVIKNELCGNRAKETLDFDIPKIRQVEFVPVCSDKHKAIAQRDIAAELKKKKYIATGFGRNGFGRA